MVDSAPLLPPRLYTMHQTVLYVDEASGELRGGGHADSPANARLRYHGASAQIIHTAGNVDQPIICGTDRSRVSDKDAPETGTIFEIVPLDDSWIGLRAGDRFLSAIPDGSVSLNAEVCDAWENFLPADPPHRLTDTKSGYTPTLSISCVETRDDRYLARAARAVERTAACIKTKCLYWFSNSPFPGALPNVDIVYVKIDGFSDFIEDINRLYLYRLPEVVRTDFNLLVQDHAFAVNPQAWDPTFLEYDYVGAPFCGLWGGGPYWRGPIVGNGGFSLRSRRLYDALLDFHPKWRVEDWLPYDERLKNFFYYVLNKRGEKCIPEDVLISVWARKVLEERYGLKYCPAELASKFSVLESHPLTAFWLGRSFGFHGEGVASHYGVSLT